MSFESTGEAFTRREGKLLFKSLIARRTQRPIHGGVDGYIVHHPVRDEAGGSEVALILMPEFYLVKLAIID